MKYLVIWFIITSGQGYMNGDSSWTYSPVFEKINKDTTHRTNRNYVIVDTFEEAKKIATEKIQGNFFGEPKVFIYEVGKGYNVVPKKYKTMELQEVSKMNIEIMPLDKEKK